MFSLSFSVLAIMAEVLDGMEMWAILGYRGYTPGLLTWTDLLLYISV